MPTVSKEIEPVFRHVYGAVAAIATEMGIPFVVVGASARDLVMHHLHGAPIQRATKDIDIGLQVSSWAAFESLRKALIKGGCSETKMPHRLLSPHKVQIDIVPFGAIKDENAKIEWPDDKGVKMNVLGFQEACDHSEMIRIQEDPIVDVPVASPAGMTLLKLIAWIDRPRELKGKDATDLRFLLANYDRIPSVLNEIYEHPELGDLYEGDTTLMSGELLGKHSAAIAGRQTKNAIYSHIIENSSNQDRLALQMCGGGDTQFESTKKLFNAFLKGFTASG